MDYIDNFHPTLNNNDLYSDADTKEFERNKKNDRGYNKLFRMVKRGDIMKRTKVEVYTSGDVGCSIRDAETGNYYTSVVGSADEDLYFKVGISTGECKSANGSTTLFYLSPQHYMKHQHTEVDPSAIERWENKRALRLAETKNVKKVNVASFVDN
jgi:hypothetical protein